MAHVIAIDRSSARCVDIAGTFRSHDVHDYLSIQFLIYQIGARFSSASAVRYREFGLNLFGVRVLVYLGRYGATTVGELSKATSIDQPSLSHMLKRMVRDKLITKHRQRHDNRIVQVRLTHAGTELAAQCMEISARHERALVASLQPDEVEQLRSALVRVFESLEDISGSENLSG